MQPRIDLFANEIAAKFTKRFANASLVISHSSLPKATQEFLRKAPIDRFIAEMKAMRATVLEIGARVVGPHSSLYAERFEVYTDLYPSLKSAMHRLRPA